VNPIRSQILCLIVVIIVIAAGVLRTGIVLQDFLWLDELHTSWSTKLSLAQVAERAGQGNQTPLYFWLTWPVVQLLEQNRLSLRLVSLVSGLATISVCSFWVWKLTRSSASTLTVAWLLSVDSWSMFYGTEARPYALLTLLGVIQIQLFWKLFQSNLSRLGRRTKKFPDKNLIFLTLVTSALFYCHYCAIWLLIAESIFVGLLTCLPLGRISNLDHGGRGATFSRWFGQLGIVAILTAVFCFPLASHVWDVFERRNNWATVSDPIRLMTEMQWPFASMLLIPSLVRLFDWRYRSSSTCLPAAAEFKGARGVDSAKFLSLIFLWAVIPTAGVVILDWLEIAPMALHRYSVIGSAACPVFAAVSLHLLSNGLLRLTLAFFLVAAALMESGPTGIQSNLAAREIVFTLDVPKFRSENWRDPVRDINRLNAEQDFPIFLFSNLVEDAWAQQETEKSFSDYLRFPVRGIYSIEQSDARVLPGTTLRPPRFSEQDLSLIRQQKGAYLIVRGRLDLVLEICNEAESRILEGDLARQSGSARVEYAQYPGSNVYAVSIEL
jgi:hypothetical protein